MPRSGWESRSGSRPSVRCEGGDLAGTHHTVTGRLWTTDLDRRLTKRLKGSARRWGINMANLPLGPTQAQAADMLSVSERA